MTPPTSSSVTSPVTGSTNVEIWDRIDPRQIEACYTDYIGIDVSRHFQGLESDVLIYKCLDSQYRFYHPFDTIGDARFYQELTAAFPYSVDMQRSDYDDTLAVVQPGMRVLDIGCGPGFFLERVRAKGGQASGLELNKTVASSTATKGFEVHSVTIEEFAKDHANEFDVVSFFQVLEHVADVRSFLDAALAVVKPGGLMVIGVPNNNPYLLVHDRMHTLNLPPHHMGLWDKESLSALPQFFAMDAVQVVVDPLLEFRKRAKVTLQHYGWKKAAAWVARLPGIVDSILTRSIGRLFAGRAVLAIYRKRAAAS